MHIRPDDLTHPAVIALIGAHLQNMHLHSPPESVHALDPDRLRQPGISFWSAWDGEALMGCGALKALAPDHGEIKSMRTVETHLRRGVASRMLEFILDEAQRRAYRRLSLETGSMEAFAPARALYARYGFRPCGPFGDYADDPHSVFMTREL